MIIVLTRRQRQALGIGGPEPPVDDEALMLFIAARLRDIRQEYGRSQAQVSAALGISANTVSRWETGVYEPGIKDLVRLAHYYGVGLSELLPEALL